MSAFKKAMMDIAASLWYLPATFEELRERDFMKNISEYGAALWIGEAERYGWIYQRGNKYFTYKKTVKQVLNRNGYEIDNI